MKIEKDRAIYPLDISIGLLHLVRLLWKGKYYTLQEVYAGQLPANEEKVTGIPRFFSLFPEFPTKFIKLYPIPDEDARIIIRDYPPLQEY